MKPKVSRILFMLLPAVILAAALGLGFVLLKALQREEPLPALGRPGAWALTNAQGQVFSSRELEGRTWLASFMFTRCEGICPVMNGRLAEVYRMYTGEDAPRIVSFSVDPEHDQPDVLRQYSMRWGAQGDPRWQFLTGPIDEIHRLAVDEFHVGSKTDPLDHSSRLILVDREGEIRGYYDSMDAESVDRLVKDLRPMVDR